MRSDFPLFPDAASTTASQVDHLVFAWLAISVFFAVLIAGLILYFFTKYRRRRADEVGSQGEINTLPLELTWSAIPLVIALAMFAWGTKVFVVASRPPGDAVEYYVTAKQWMWKFQHPEGNREIDALHVPVGQPIKLTMTSQDVIHSLYIPAFRVKADVLPGRYTTVWFRATRPGRYHLFCAEYCGTEHSKMGGWVTVMGRSEYEAWLRQGAGGTPLRATGERLFEKLACNTCHLSGGAAKEARAPSLDNLFERQVQLQDGSTVTADVNYLRESILDPGSKITAGWQPIMPTYRGQVSEEELNALVEYMKTLGKTQAAGESPAAPRVEGSTEGRGL